MTNNMNIDPVNTPKDPFGGRWNFLLGEVVEALDQAAQWGAGVLSRFTRVTGAGCRGDCELERCAIRRCMDRAQS